MKTLEEAFELVNSLKLNKERHYKLTLIVEELVVNILKYTKADEYTLHIEQTGNLLFVKIVYKDKSFNPTNYSKEEKDIEEMSFGGLGLFLVNSLAKRVEYNYIEGKNIVKVEL